MVSNLGGGNKVNTDIGAIMSGVAALVLAFVEVRRLIGERKGKELILKAIKDYATRIGEQAKANVAAQGLDNNPANYQGDLPL